MELPILFTYDSDNRPRQWTVEVIGSRYRFITGIVGGSLVVSEWTTAEAKNVGRANETAPEEQAQLEAKSAWTKKTETGYATSIETSGTAYHDPMLAEKYNEKRIANQDVYIQPKLDGIRCIARSDGLWSRKGKPFVAVPHIVDQIKHLFLETPDLVLDGELYSHDLRDDFNAITSHVKKQKVTEETLKAARIVEYHVYDCFFGRNPEFTFDQRMARVRDRLAAIGQHIKLVPTHLVEAGSTHQMDELFSEWLAEGYEGQMVRINAPYEIGKRSHVLMKRKELLDDEFRIFSIEEGVGNWSGAAKSIQLVLPDGRIFGAGLKGTREYAVEVLKKRHIYTGGMASVRFLNYTPDGVPRGGIVYNLYPGERDD